MKKLAILFLFLTGNLHSQEYVNIDAVNIKGAFSPLTFDFNLDDFYWSISGGVEDITYEWSAKLNFEFRPFEKKVQIIETDNVIRQYKEVKYFISIDIDKRFLNFHLWGARTQFFVGTRTGFLFGNYKGTRADDKPNFITTPMAGICFHFNENANLKLGAIYFSDGLVSVPDARATLGINFIF